MSNSHTKFGLISPNGLGGDSVTDGLMDGRTDGGDCNIPDAFLKKRGDNYCISLPMKHNFEMFPEIEE